VRRLGTTYNSQGMPENLTSYSDTTYIKRTGEANGSAADQYTGLDRFNRVVDQRTLTSSSGSSLDRYAYGYDRNSNRIYKENLVSTSNSELYTFDLADRVLSMQRGTLDAGKTGSVGATLRSQSWDLDKLGNSNSVTTDSSVQTRTHNAQNELLTLGSTGVAYDSEGNWGCKLFCVKPSNWWKQIGR